MFMTRKFENYVIINKSALQAEHDGTIAVVKSAVGLASGHFTNSSSKQMILMEPFNASGKTYTSNYVFYSKGSVERTNNFS